MSSSPNGHAIYEVLASCGGHEVRALEFVASARGSSPGWEHCIYSHGTSLHPGVEMGTGEFTAGG